MFRISEELYIRCLRRVARWQNVKPILQQSPGYVKSQRSVTELIGGTYSTIRNKKHGPLLFVALPKSGGSWLTIMLSEIAGFFRSQKQSIKKCEPCREKPWSALHPVFSDMTDFTDDALNSYQGQPVILHAHLAPTDENLQAVTRCYQRFVVQIRDPRDVMVSLYFHLLNRETPYQARVAQLDKKDGLQFVLDEFLVPFLSFIELWSDHGISTGQGIIVKYEDVVADPEAIVTDVLHYFGISTSSRRIRGVVDRYRLKSTPDRENAITDADICASTKIRKGTPGDWKNHLLDSHLQFIAEHGGQTLNKYYPG